MSAIAIKDLKVGDRVVTNAGTGTITSVEPFQLLETTGQDDALEVAWEVNGDPGFYVGGGCEMIELANTEGA